MITFELLDVHFINGSFLQIFYQIEVLVNRFDHKAMTVPISAEFFTVVKILTNIEDEITFQKTW